MKRIFTIHALCSNGRFGLSAAIRCNPIKCPLCGTNRLLAFGFRMSGSVASKLYNEITEEEIEYEDVPEDFCDPILMTMIEEPIMIPEMDLIVEESVIKRHLLTTDENPFNRRPLTTEQLNEYNKQEDVIQKINEWKKKLNEWKKNYNRI